MSEEMKMPESIKKLESFMHENHWTPQTLLEMARVLIFQESKRRVEGNQSNSVPSNNSSKS